MLCSRYAPSFFNTPSAAPQVHPSDFTRQGSIPLFFQPVYSPRMLTKSYPLSEEITASTILSVQASPKLEASINGTAVDQAPDFMHQGYNDWWNLREFEPETSMSHSTRQELPTCGCMGVVTIFIGCDHALLKVVQAGCLEGVEARKAREAGLPSLKHAILDKACFRDDICSKCKRRARGHYLTSTPRCMLRPGDEASVQADLSELLKIVIPKRRKARQDTTKRKKRRAVKAVKKDDAGQEDMLTLWVFLCFTLLLGFCLDS